MIESLRFRHAGQICTLRMKPNLKTLFLIIVICLAIRVCYVITLEDRFYFPDSVRYDRIASELIQGEGFSSSFTAPLYPVFLSWVYTLFGHSLLTVRIIHSIIGTASVLIMYLLGREMFSEKAGLTAALLGSVYPFFIFFTGLVLTETLFIFLLLCLVLFFRKITVQILPGSAGTTPITNKNLRAGLGYAICTGILAGVSILIKPAMLYFLLFFFTLILVIYRGRRKRISLHALLICLIAGFVISPWAYDNYKRTGKFIFLTTGGGYTLYESNNPRATGGPAGERIVWSEEMKKMDKVELDKHFKREAVLFIKNNPRRFLELAVIKIRRFWSFTPNAGGYQNRKYKTISTLSYGPIVLLALWQVAATRKRWRELAFLYLPILFFTLLHTVILGSLRYRIPVMPYVIIFAANGISKFLPSK